MNQPLWNSATTAMVLGFTYAGWLAGKFAGRVQGRVEKLAELAADGMLMPVDKPVSYAIPANKWASPIEVTHVYLDENGKKINA